MDYGSEIWLSCGTWGGVVQNDSNMREQPGRRARRPSARERRLEDIREVVTLAATLGATAVQLRGNNITIKLGKGAAETAAARGAQHPKSPKRQPQQPTPREPQAPSKRAQRDAERSRLRQQKWWEQKQLERGGTRNGAGAGGQRRDSTSACSRSRCPAPGAEAPGLSAAEQLEVRRRAHLQAMASMGIIRLPAEPAADGSRMDVDGAGNVETLSQSNAIRCFYP